MERVLAAGKRYSLDTLMAGNGISVAEIVNVHRIPKVLAGAQVYAFRINDAQHLAEFGRPLFTSNIFVRSILPALVDERSVATFSFPSAADVPIYKWHLFEKLLEHDIARVVSRSGGNSDARFELKLNRGGALGKLDLVGFSTTVRLPTARFQSSYANLCRQLDGPQWSRLDGTVEVDLLSGRPRFGVSLDAASRAMVA